MSTQFLEFNSLYRDRNTFPIPGQFEALMTLSGDKLKAQAVDPVCNSAINIIFSPNDFDQTGATAIVGAIAPAPAGGGVIGNATDYTSIIVQMTTGDAHQEFNYYRGAVMTVTNAGPPATTGVTRISEWRYLSTNGGFDYFKVDVLAAVVVVAGDVVTITNPSDIADPEHPLFFIPTGINATNYYYNYIIYNQTQNDSRPIDYYSSVNHVARCDAVGDPIVGWTLLDTYILRRVPPEFTGAAVAGTINTVQLAATSPAVDEFFVGDFIRITSGAAQNDVRRIINYVGATQTVTVQPSFSAVVAPGNTYEIQVFTRDNAVPIQYTGSITSHREAVCYDIELLNLILPNSTLISGYGGRAIFYPFVYVELRGINNSEGQGVNVIWSNNPNARRALFRAVVSDTTQPVTSPFIKIDGSGMKQRIKFMPNDSFLFSVRLPNGEIFQTEQTDFFSPREPDPLVQVSAIFSLKRVS
jgi:hypothetical protein